jgi:hypothetical protein
VNSVIFHVHIAASVQFKGALTKFHKLLAAEDFSVGYIKDKSLIILVNLQE